MKVEVEGKEVRWWATDRLVRGPTVTLAAFRSLRPCTCWIMADRRGGGVAVEGKCGEKLECHGLTCKSTERAQRQLRGDRLGYSRPARRDVPRAGVWCVPGWPVTTDPSWYVTRNARIDVWSRLSGKVPGRFDPDRRTKSQLLLSLSYER